MTSTSNLSETRHSLYRREIGAGEARVAVFTRIFDAAIEDVWEACTDPVRLSRWYAPVEGDLRLGGEFIQGDFGPGKVVRCEAPRLLTVALGGGDPSPDEIELRLSEDADGLTLLTFEHATTIDTHTIGGEVFDAVYCMGGGYGPRLVTLDRYLRGELAEDVDPSLLHLDAGLLPAIEQSMAALAELVETDKREHAS
jgi:uncharacterized protein YndB with AHSA1/START domain